MEADWSVELAADDPAISVPWVAIETAATEPGVRFLDLRNRSPHELENLLEQVRETHARPSLRAALAMLNRAGSMLWTSKCDAWEGRAGSGENEKVTIHLDPWEMDATPEEAIFFAGCYIDLLIHDAQARRSFEIQERWLRRLSGPLRGIPLRCARTDLVLRRAEIDGESGFGVTCFVEACGGKFEAATRARDEALGATLPVLMEKRWLWPYSESADATMT